MLTAAEIARGTQGALGFLRRDPAALLAFDNTMEACLRSFRLMAVTAPFYVVYSLIRYANLTVAIDTSFGFDVVWDAATSTLKPTLTPPPSSAVRARVVRNNINVEETPTEALFQVLFPSVSAGLTDTFAAFPLPDFLGLSIDVSEIAETDAIALFDELGLREHMTTQRSNGLVAMVNRIRNEARAVLA